MPRAKWPKVGDLVVVNWLDIMTHDGWASPSDEVGLAECKTVGWVTALCDKSVTVASTTSLHVDGEGAVNSRTCIPRSCVTSWSVVR